MELIWWSFLIQYESANKISFQKNDGYWDLTKEKFYLQWPYYLPLKPRVLFLPLTFAAANSHRAVHTLYQTVQYCVLVFQGRVSQALMRKEKVFVEWHWILYMFSYSLPSKTGALFLSYFTFEYFEYKTFRAEEHCLHSANILTYFRKKGEKTRKPSWGKKKNTSRILSKGFLIFNSFMYIKLDMSVSVLPLSYSSHWSMASSDKDLLHSI